MLFTLTFCRARVACVLVRVYVIQQNQFAYVRESDGSGIFNLDLDCVAKTRFRLEHMKKSENNTGVPCRAIKLPSYLDNAFLWTLLFAEKQRNYRLASVKRMLTDLLKGNI